MRAFHFVKYDSNTRLEQLLKHTAKDTTICFDLEDSIQDCLNPSNTAALKAEYRTYFRTMLQSSNVEFGQSKAAIRINAVGSPDYFLDLAILAGIRKVDSIFVPKVESRKEILKLNDDLRRNGVQVQKLFPVIESGSGMENIDDILSAGNNICGVAFGHCDYNLDCGHYPFFHQECREYWSWIKKISVHTNHRNLLLINSPFLQLDNFDFFGGILKVLSAIGKDFAAQITLTRKQTDICTSFSIPAENSAVTGISNRLDLRVPEGIARNFIECFERNLNGRGFAVNEKRMVLSPHEYRASLDLQRSVTKQRSISHLSAVVFRYRGIFPLKSSFIRY
jgi:citrate lyase beta subunit